MNSHPFNYVLGRQQFDGLGRPLSVSIGGRTSLHHYLAGQLPPSANTLADGRWVRFAYIAALDNLLQRIQPDGEPATDFTYDPRLAQVNSATGALGTQRMTYDPSGQPGTDVWSVDGADHTTTWHHTLGGLLLGFEDASQVNHQRHLDTFGRLRQVVVGDVTCDIDYDAFSRPLSYSTLDLASGNRLLQTLTYDNLGREQSRTFVATLAEVTRRQAQTLTYNDLDQVVTRHWQDDDREGSEHFGYDLRGRLIHYRADPAVAPEDPFGNRVIEQRFVLNELDGYEKVLTRFADGSCDESGYHYDNIEDPCQVSRITHTHPGWPATIALHYDACGRLCADSLGRTLTWDTQDRVTRVEYQGRVCEYAYDPSGNLSDRRVDGVLSRSFHSAGQLTHEQCGDEVIRLAADAGQLFALDRLSAGVRQGNVTLLGCDAQGSVRVEADSVVRNRRYTAHGAEPGTSGKADNPFGFTGERREPLTGWYIPAGYRPYDPLLMIFLAPDSASPFGRGGLNTYAYCGGDPVNRVDPDGHSWWKWLVTGIGIVLGAVATVASFGAAAPAFAAVAASGLGALTASGAAAITGATLGAVSLGTGIASTTLGAVDKDSKAAGILGWISLGTGLAGSTLEIAPKAATALATKARAIGRAAVKSSKTTAMAKPGISGNISNNLIEPTKVSAPVTLYSKGGGSADVAFHPNYLGSGTAAFETHGSTTGLLMDTTGAMVKPQKVGYRAKAWLDANRPEGEPFTLIACHAAESGAAQIVADVTNRPVTAFKQAIYVHSPMESMSLVAPNGALNIPLQAGPRSFLDIVSRRSAQAVPAQSRIFVPRSFVA